MSSLTTIRTRAWLAALFLLAVTLVLTLSRAMRWPNDFAEAHWLLDYRFGFVKRGLAGQLFSSTLGLAGTEPSAVIITFLSVTLLTTLAVLLVWMAWQLLRSTPQPASALLVALAFLSSPFIVMSAHLIGYLDGILIVLSAVAVGLALRGRPWAAGAVQAAAILVHESAILVGFPVLCLAWWVAASRDGSRGSLIRRAAPLMLPIAAFAAVALSAGTLPPDVQDRLSQHLSRFAFVEGDMHIFVPEWLTPGFAQQVAEQKHRFGQRIASAEMYGLILPTVLALLAWTVDACRVRARSITFALLIGATLAPQLMHVAAWDTVRIWTYSVAMAWLGAWTLARANGADGIISTGVRGLALAAIVVNVLAATPLLDNLADRYTLTARLALYAPIVVVALVLFLRPQSATGERSGRPS